MLQGFLNFSRFYVNLLPDMSLTDVDLDLRNDLLNDYNKRVSFDIAINIFASNQFRLNCVQTRGKSSK